MKYDVVIIGSGLGGMISGAILAKAGKSVIVLEKSNRIGGRFTNIYKDGFSIPSGAFHLTPYGEKGILKFILNHLGYSDRIRPLTNNSFWIKGKYYDTSKKELIKMFNIKDSLTLALILSSFEKIYHNNKDNNKITFADELKKHTQSRKIFDFFSSFSHFSIGCFIDSIPAKDFAQIMQKVIEGARPGYIKGGCGALISDLQDTIEDSGSKIITNLNVIKLNTNEKNEIISVQTDTKETITGDLFIYNGVPQRLNSLIDGKPAIEVPENLPIAQGAAIHFSSDTPPTDKKGMVLTLGMRTIPGFVVTSNFDPNLAPKGKSLTSVCFDSSQGNLKENTEKAMLDLKDIFGADFVEKELKLLRICNYSKHWPANNALQGFDFNGKTIYDNLFLVGDGCKPEGYIMAEGVAASVIATGLMKSYL